MSLEVSKKRVFAVYFAMRSPGMSAREQMRVWCKRLRLRLSKKIRNRKMTIARLPRVKGTANVSAQGYNPNSGICRGHNLLGRRARAEGIAKSSGSWAVRSAGEPTNKVEYHHRSRGRHTTIPYNDISSYSIKMPIAPIVGKVRTRLLGRGERRGHPGRPILGLADQTWIRGHRDMARTDEGKWRRRGKREQEILQPNRHLGTKHNKGTRD